MAERIKSLEYSTHSRKATKKFNAGSPLQRQNTELGNDTELDRTTTMSDLNTSRNIHDDGDASGPNKQPRPQPQQEFCLQTTYGQEISIDLHLTTRLKNWSLIDVKY